jgi:hypothetical protein
MTAWLMVLEKAVHFRGLTYAPAKAIFISDLSLHTNNHPKFYYIGDG